MPSASTIIWNDKVITDPHQQKDLLNRAFRYGDGLFETILLRSGKPVFWEAHLDRMLKGMQILGFDFEAVEWRNCMAQITVRIAQESESEYAKLRLFVFRTGEGAFAPSTDIPTYCAQYVGMKEDPWVQKTGLHLGVYRDIPLQYSILSAVKSLSAIPYVLAARFANSQGWDDVLMLSPNGNFAESSSANLFLIHGNQLHTSPLTSGCLPGTMRKNVLIAAQNLGMETAERGIDQQALEEADDIFLSNALRCVQCVNAIDGMNIRSNLSSMMDPIRAEIYKMSR